MRFIRLYEVSCLRCGKTWHSKNRKPLRCGKCKSPYYAIQKKTRRSP